MSKSLYTTIKETTSPTTATVGIVGQCYIDLTNQKYYICTSASDSTYTWKEIASANISESSTEVVKKVVYDNTTLADHIEEILGYVNGENGGSLINLGFKVGSTAITGTRKTVTLDTTTNTISSTSATETIVGSGHYLNCTFGGLIAGSTSGKRATFLCANDMENCSQANLDISNVNGETKVLLSGQESGFLTDNIVNIYFNQIDISAVQLEHLDITYHI